MAPDLYCYRRNAVSPGALQEDILSEPIPEMTDVPFYKKTIENCFEEQWALLTRIIFITT